MKNIQCQSIVDPKKLMLPPLHIELSLMKQFFKALDKEGDCFKHLCEIFSILSTSELKVGIVVGPDVRKLLHDQEFETTMSTIIQREAWIVLMNVVPATKKH